MSNIGAIAVNRAFEITAGHYTGWTEKGLSIEGDHYTHDVWTYLSRSAVQNLSVVTQALAEEALSGEGSVLKSVVKREMFWGNFKDHNFTDFAGDINNDKFVKNIKGVNYSLLSTGNYSLLSTRDTEAGVKVLAGIARVIQSGRGNDEEREFWGKNLPNFVTNKIGLFDWLRFSSRSRQHGLGKIKEGLVISSP